MTQRERNWNLPAPHFARHETERLLKHVLEEAGRVLTQPDEDAVHDLRVAIRRFSQAVRIFANLLPGPARKMRKRLRRLLAVAATVRDLDVGIALLTQAGLAPEEPVLTEMQNERRVACHRLLGEAHLLHAEEPHHHWLARLHGGPA
jgi:CHAD domain-containing protein